MWRELYPVGIHYLIGQILGSAVLLWLVDHVSNAQESYYSYTLVITGLTGVLVMFPAVYFYRKDRIGRLIGGLTSIEEQRLSVPEMLLLLGAGAGFAQYANVLVAILQNWISSSYGETMTKITSGKSFRWLVYLRLRDHFSVLVSAVISAAFFGIYHGNVLQAVYAFILGALFAWFLEMGGNKWTSVLMHIGANTWILIFSEYAQTLVEKTGAGSLLMIYGIFAVVMIGGYQYFVRRGEKRGYRAV